MRYEDASQTGSMTSEVAARDDTDHLAGNDFGPATGNLITGSGTISGAAGVDQAGPGAHITAIAGVGGSDNEFDASGKLEVAGQYGMLTIDAEGNYTYVRNPGSPEGVSDTFTYTLADAAGAADSAQLVIAIGNPPILQAQGTQTIRTAEGVVVLPPGVELSDVRVVGRDLVITLPDGSTMVIADGAIFVPQLVVDGVEVPASNLAALLIDAEPKPAAGDSTPNQLSSGGNFALPPPPLDPGVPLGDLLPPTELDYTPPEFEDPGIEPEGNEAPLIGTSAVSVSDEGVSSVDTPLPDNLGSPDTTNLRIVQGVLPVSDPDGDLLTVTLGVPASGLTSQGTLIVWSVSPDGQTVTGTAGPAGPVVITVEIDSIDASGAHYTVTQSHPIDQPNASIEDAVTFVVPASVSDGELTTVGGTISVTVEDDSPVVDNVVSQGGVTLDETDAVPTGFPISGNSELPVIDFDALFGADGAAAVDASVLSLVITGGGGTGLQTAVGDFPITLSQFDSVTIHGLYDGSNIAFIIHLEADDTITLTQNVPLEHLVDGPPGPAHNDSLDLGGLVAVSVTVADRDGDEASAQVGIGDALVFVDDGPDAARATNAIGTIVLDETRPVDTDTDDGTAPDGVMSGTIDFSTKFNAPDYGADGAGTTTYKLVLSADGIGSGLYALEAGDTDDGGDLDGYGQGDEITLSINEAGTIITGSAGDPAVDYFTIEINTTTGVVTFTQLSPIWHPDLTDSFDETATLNTEAAGDIVVRQTVTDSDGDFDTADADVGRGVFAIQDDGPDPYDPCPDEVISVNDPDADPFTGGLNLPDVGEDEPGVVSFGVADGEPVLDTEGNPVTSGEDPLFYFINDLGVLEARVGDETGELIFTITLNGDGTFTYDQVGQIGIGGTINFDDLTSSDAGNAQFAGIGADDPATEVDVLLSAEKDGSSDTVNTDSDSIGSQNQSMDAGETVRIDFVSNLESGGATPSGFTYGNHVTSSTFLGLIPQVQGEQDQTVAFTVYALDSTNTDAAEPDRDPTGAFSDSTITQITEVTVKDYLTGSTHTEAVSFTDGTTFETLAFGMSVRVNADGSVTFSGVQQGDSYGFSTGAGEFNAVAVAAEPAGTGTSTQDSFDLGVFSIGVANEFEPVDLEVPIILTDADGDPVECHIDIHIGEPLVAADVTVTVNEAGLPLLISGEIGSDSGSNSEIQSGVLTPSGGTGPYSFMLLSNANGQFGNLVLNPDTGEFTYTLDTPFDTTPDADDGTNPEIGAESFDVLITDSEGATHTATITINIIDDVPSAESESDVVEGGVGPATGNVMTGDDIVGGDTNTSDGVADVEGADGAQVTRIESDNNGNFDEIAAGGNFVVIGQYGTLTINQNGNYSYTRTDLEAGGVEDVFIYTITDGDGDTATATLTIGIEDAFPEAGNVNVQLDDDALAGGNLGGTDDVDPDTANLTGSLPGSGGDGTHTFSVLLTGAPAGFTYESGGAGILLIKQDGETKITVTVESDGSYEVEQNNPIDHPTPGTSEENVQFTVNYRVTDGDDDFDDGTITIDVDDDTPTIVRNQDSAPALVTDDTDTPNDTAGPTSFAALFTGAFGADGPKDADDNDVEDADALRFGLSITGGNGTDSGLNDTLSGDNILLRVVGNTIEGYLEGTPATVAFTISLNPDTGAVTLEQDRAIVHDNPADHVESGGSAATLAANLVVLTATIEDGDGDTASATANIGGSFQFEDDGPSISRNGTAAPTLVTDDTDTPNDTAGPTSFAGLFTAAFGKDSFKDADDNDVEDADALRFGLSITGGNGTDSGLNDTLSGDNILLRVVGNTIEGYLEGTPATVAFTISLNPDTGAVTLEQDRAIVHDNPADHVESGGSAATLAANLVVLTATIEDGDGDTASATANIGGSFQFEDDGPSISRNGTTAPTLVTDDTDTPNDTAGPTSFAGLFTAAFGKDSFKDADDNDVEDADALRFGLSITGGNGTDSGLNDTLSGDNILLRVVGNTIEGYLEGTPATVAFTISLNPDTGAVTLEQDRAIVHDNPADHVESGGSAATLAANLVVLTATIEDGDGDTASATANIGGSFQFEDDGPSISRNSETAPILVTDDTDTPNDTANGNFGALFTGLFGKDSFKDSDDNDVEDANAIRFALSITGGNGTDSGLNDTLSGDNILLRVVGNTIEGYLEGTPATVAFTISLNPDTGAVTLEQDRAIEHDDPLDPLETNAGGDAETMAASLIKITATIEDGDGDTASATANIGDSFRFEDDGPVAIQPVAAVLENEIGASVTRDLDNDSEVLLDFGADGPGLVQFANITNGQDTLLKSGGVTIELFLSNNDQTVTGKINANPDGTGGTTIFTVALNQADGDYTVTMAGTIDNGSGVTFNNLSGGVAGNPPFKLITEPGVTLEILATPINGGSINSDTDDMGVDGQFIQILDDDADPGNPADDATLQLDFGNFTYDANGGGTSDDAFVMVSHQNINGFRWTIDQISEGTTADIRLTAIDADNDGGVEEQAPNPAGDVIDPITAVKIFQVTEVDGELVYTQVGPLAGYTTDSAIGATGATIDFEVGGTVLLSNMPSDYAIQTYTASGYSRIQIANAGDDVDSGDNDGKFSVSQFSIETTQTGTAVELNLDLKITDGDGDTVTMVDAIDITFNPAIPPVVLDMDGDGAEFLGLEAGVAYDYGAGLVTTAWAGSDDAILVRDANGDGTVTDSSEFVFGGNGVTDLEALHAQYGDQLDASDADFTMFALWNDANSNGVVDGNELQSLAEAGIASIGLVSDGISYTAADGDVSVAGTATYTKADGSTGDVADASFAIGDAKATQEVERVAANSNSVTLAAAVAAAGLAAATSAAAEGIGGAEDSAISSVVSVDSLSDTGVDAAYGSPAFETGNPWDAGFEASIAALSSSSHTAIATSQVGELSAELSLGSDVNSLLEATELEAAVLLPTPSNGMQVALPPVDALAAEGSDGNSQTNGVVEQILADALSGGGSGDINAILNALPGAGLGDLAAVNGLASPGGEGVPTSDTAQYGGFTFDPANIMTDTAMVLHHDAIQPVANG